MKPMAACDFDMFSAEEFSEAMARTLNRLRVEFLEDFRYAEERGPKYPVLLTSFQDGSRYEEDMRDQSDYPSLWKTQFVADLREAGCAIIASDSNPKAWHFMALHSVSEIQLTNFLTCKIGKKIAALNFA